MARVRATLARQAASVNERYKSGFVISRGRRCVCVCVCVCVQHAV